MIKPKILSDEAIDLYILDPDTINTKESYYNLIRAQNDYCYQEMLGQFTEFLRKHCRGYHQGNNGKEFGHFGIYRDEIKALQGLEEG